MEINGIKVKEVEQTGKAYSCKGCIFYNPELFERRNTVCQAPDDVICNFGMIFVKDE